MGVLNMSKLLSSMLCLLLMVLAGCTHRSEIQQRARKNTRAPEKKIEVAQDLVAPPEMKKMLKNMTIPELERAKNYCVATGNKTQAIIYLEQIIILATDQNMLKDVRLELADLYFDQGSISKASKMYASYLGLYPGSEDRAYVHYRAILCRFYETYSSDRDQTPTEEALILTQEYLNRVISDKELYAAYSTDVEIIQKQCCKKLFDHDKGILDFYYKKGNFKAAQLHLLHMKKMYAKLYKESEPELLTCECDIAYKTHDTGLLLATQTELKAKYPEFHATVIAQQEPKKSYGNRF